MRSVAVLVATSVLLGAAPLAAYDEADFFAKTIPAYSIPTPPKNGPGPETVVGQVRAYRIRKGDTLMDLARYYSLGYNEIVEANPGIDPWVPPAGATILLPTEWVLPCCTYEGVVVNIPEMRLYFYRRAPGDPGTTIVHTFPVGLGRDDWRTPSGKFRIRGKTVNPQWNIPESIRKEHIADRGDARTFIPGGDPDNPLGKHRIELTLPMYGIHGTNIPWGVGMQVSHGCVRLYPEDIERLFPLVPVGAPGEFAYQPVKAGQRAGAVYVEMHKDIYGYSPALYREATEVLARAHLADRVDERRLLGALDEGGGGMPVRVSAAPAGEIELVPASAPAAEAQPASPPPAPRPTERADDRAPYPDDDEAGDD
jgi:L,D-transpeptidase ErfK/SrfK